LIDAGVKSTVADFCGKDEYEFGDLSSEMDKRVKDRVSEFTGQEGYSFGDVSKEIENRRQEWAKDLLGEEALANYQFGDVSADEIVV
jgi:hypothetical protein